MTDLGYETLGSDTPRALIERSRALFAAHGDERGVHLCEIALAQTTSDPGEALTALLSPLERLAATQTLTGLDVIAGGVLVAARALGARDLEARVHGLVVATDSPELRARVFVGLWDRIETLVESGDLAGGLTAGWAALGLAVALDDFMAAAVSLVRIAGCHEAVAQSDPDSRDARAASLCLEQAARYLMRAGRPSEAGDLFLDAARHRPAGTVPSATGPQPRTPHLLEEAIRAFEEAGIPDRVAECRTEVARSFLASGRPREAIRMLQKALGVIEGPESLAVEVGVWEMLAEAHRQAGDPDAATAAEYRARLLREGLPSPGSLPP